MPSAIVQPTRSALVSMFARARTISEKVVSPSRWKKAKSPYGSASQPNAWGICLSTMSRPIPASIPLMTDEGKK